MSVEWKKVNENAKVDIVGQVSIDSKKNVKMLWGIFIDNSFYFVN